MCVCVGITHRTLLKSSAVGVIGDVVCHCVITIKLLFSFSLSPKDSLHPFIKCFILLVFKRKFVHNLTKKLINDFFNYLDNSFFFSFLSFILIVIIPFNPHSSNTPPHVQQHYHCTVLWRKRFPQPVLLVRTSYFSGDGRGDLVLTTAAGIHITHIEPQSAIETIRTRMELVARLARLCGGQDGIAPLPSSSSSSSSPPPPPSTSASSSSV